MAGALSRLRSGAYGALAETRKAAAVTVVAVSAAFASTLAPAAAQAEVVIAALGDSLTQGFGLPPEQGFVPVLEGWLHTRGQDVRLVNAGVSGDTTAGGLSRVGWTLTPEIDAMIVALGGNDLLRGIDPSVSRANLDGILEAASAAGVEVLLIGISAPGNYGPEFKAAFEAMYPELADTHGALYEANFLAGLEAARDNGAQVGDVMQADAIHPNAKGVKIIVETLGPQVEALVERVLASEG
ncbi:MAG: arylesterase [Pseudomonadota bacterium]